MSRALDARCLLVDDPDLVAAILLEQCRQRQFDRRRNRGHACRRHRRAQPEGLRRIGERQPDAAGAASRPSACGAISRNFASGLDRRQRLQDDLERRADRRGRRSAGRECRRPRRAESERATVTTVWPGETVWPTSAPTAVTTPSKSENSRA